MRKLRFKPSKVAQLWSPTSRGHAIGHQAPLSWPLNLSFEREENITPYQCQSLSSQIHSGEDGPWQQAVCRLCVLGRVCSDPIGHTICWSHWKAFLALARSSWLLLCLTVGGWEASMGDSHYRAPLSFPKTDSVRVAQDAFWGHTRAVSSPPPVVCALLCFGGNHCSVCVVPNHDCPYKRVLFLSLFCIHSPQPH